MTLAEKIEEFVLHVVAYYKSDLVRYVTILLETFPIVKTILKVIGIPKDELLLKIENITIEQVATYFHNKEGIWQRFRNLVNQDSN